MDLSDTPSKIYGLKNTFSELMDLIDTPSQVGPLVHFTLNFKLFFVEWFFYNHILAHVYILYTLVQ